MCGIFGFVGEKERQSSDVLDGLRLLEYRGYDSWGVAVKNNKRIEIEKKTGKIGDSSIKLGKSKIGIGHTRWATHGGVTVANAHPHLDCTKQIAVLHNGIIENYQEIREDLVKKGHKFLSGTDTEVLPHLIEELLKKEGFATSVRDAFRKFTGLNAFVVMNARSSEIVAIKTGSPLVVGIGKDEFFVSSDVLGISKHTKKVVFLNDNEMAILGKTFQLIDVKTGNKINPKVEEITWDLKEAEKGKYKYFMLKEIFEQPAVISNIAKNYRDQIEEISKVIKKARGTFFIGCGTASYAALAGQYLFSSVAKRHVNFAIGSEFNYLEHYLNDQSLVIAISQSGETIDVVEPVSNAKKRGAKIVAITNVLGSTLYRLSDHKILLGAGPEVAVCATKSFIAMISTLIYMSYQIVDRGDEASKMLLKASENVREMLTESYLVKIKKLAAQISNQEHLYIIGRGLSYPTSLEAALKLKEVPYIHSEGFAGGELKHGVIALIEKGTPTIVFAPNDETYSSIISNAIEIKARGGYIIGVSPKNNEAFDYFLPVEDLGEATVIPNVVIAQLLAYYCALEKGLEPDKPRNLAKSVTVK